MTAATIQHQSNKVLFLSRLLSILVILAALGLVAFVVFQPITILPRIALSPGFALTDQNGHQITNEDLRGRIVLYNFTYMSCEEPCPETNSIMAHIQSRLEATDTESIPLELVTISINPDDTPAILQRYAQILNADSNRWHLITGDTWPGEVGRWWWI